MNYYNDYYITRDKKLAVEFLFVDLGYDKGWRAYILSDINYQRRSSLRSDAQTDVHRLTEQDDRMICRVNEFKRNNAPFSPLLTRTNSVEYICWTKPMYDREQLMSVASVWADITSYYIENGGTFEQIHALFTRKGYI